MAEARTQLLRRTSSALCHVYPLQPGGQFRVTGGDVRWRLRSFRENLQGEAIHEIVNRRPPASSSIDRVTIRAPVLSNLASA